jgi:HAMP domain-containing protein
MLHYIRSSFSARLSLWVTGFVTVIFVTALTLVIRYSLSVVTDESVERNMQILESAALEVDHVLHKTQFTARAAGWMVRKYLDEPDSIPDLCRQVKQANNWVERCYVTPEASASDTARWYCQALDTPADSVPLRAMTVSYRLPVLDAKGRPATTLVMDVRIDWPQYASAIITRIPYAQCFLQGEGGCYKNEAFYRPFSNQRWGLALICQEDRMLAGFYRLQTINLIVIVVVLLLLLFICRRVIDRNLKSLDQLSDTVRRLSQNRFDEPIPYKGRQDEIGELQRSFSLMQQALSSHIREMHQKTDVLTQRNAELQEAYERGLEDERAKALFLSKATTQLLPPVQAISAATGRLSTDYQSFTKQEMTNLKTEITTHSETITALSDQMLKI